MVLMKEQKVGVNFSLPKCANGDFFILFFRYCVRIR